MDDIERLRFEYDGIAYKMLSDSEVEVSRNLKIKSPDVAIPNCVEYEGKTFLVTRIGKMAFHGCREIITISIPDSVKEIDEAAFCCCEMLMTVNIPAGIGEIEYETFYGCEHLESLFIPDSVRAVRDRALWYCRGLKSISIPKHLLGIEYPNIYPKRGCDVGQCRSLDSLEHCFVRLSSGEVEDYDFD
jgi:hypothetical protein